MFNILCINHILFDSLFYFHNGRSNQRSQRLRSSLGNSQSLKQWCEIWSWRFIRPNMLKNVFMKKRLSGGAGRQQALEEGERTFTWSQWQAELLFFYSNFSCRSLWSNVHISQVIRKKKTTTFIFFKEATRLQSALKTGWNSSAWSPLRISSSQKQV